MADNTTGSIRGGVTASSAAQVIAKQIARSPKGNIEVSPGYNAYLDWEAATLLFLVRIFGEDASYVQQFESADGHPSYTETRERLYHQLALLEVLVEILQLEAESETRNAAPARSIAAEDRHGVFIVHGRDDGRIRHEVARFLEQLKQECRILHELPSKGRTIIEKFEENADVAFAIVLLTPDDRGGLAKSAYDQQKLRARQNVIFELGYFMGKLGREHVAALYSPDVEIPSDYAGILYIPFDDSGAWKVKLAQEMKAANLPVDLNLAV